MYKLFLISLCVAQFAWKDCSATVSGALDSSKYSFKIQQNAEDTLDIRVILRLEMDTMGGNLRVLNIEVLAYKVYSGEHELCFDKIVTGKIQCDSITRSYVDSICYTIRKNPSLIREGELGDLNLRMDKSFWVKVEPLGKTPN